MLDYTSFSLQLRFFSVAMLLLFALAGCKQANTQPSKNQAKQTQTSKKPTLRPKAKPKKRNVVLFLGDSLTAGYRLAASEAYPALINQHWKDNGFPWRARNAGVSGDTSAGVIRRLNWVLSDDVYAVFLCIGANDGLRGQSTQKLAENLETIVKRIQSKNIKVVLAGITLPRNYGKSYLKSFDESYIKLSKTYKLPLMPLLIKDVAGIKTLNLSDGIHPNTKGHQIIANNVLAFFKKEGLFPRSPAKQ